MAFSPSISSLSPTLTLVSLIDITEVFVAHPTVSYRAFQHNWNIQVQVNLQDSLTQQFQYLSLLAYLFIVVIFV